MSFFLFLTTHIQTFITNLFYINVNKMKSINFTTILLASFLIVGSSCNKEENNGMNNGGSFSIRSAMIVGNWRLYETVEADGSVYTLPVNEIIKWKFEADGNFTEIHDYSGTYDSSIYKWKFVNNDNKLRIIDQSNSDSSEGTISKLTEEELWGSEPNGYQVHFERK